MIGSPVTEHVGEGCKHDVENVPDLVRARERNVRIEIVTSDHVHSMVNGLPGKPSHAQQPVEQELKNHGVTVTCLNLCTEDCIVWEVQG